MQENANVLTTDVEPPEKGSTMIELMVMLSTAVIVLLATLSGVVQHGRQRRANAELSLAMGACRNTLEELRSVDFSTLPSVNGQGFDVPAFDGSPSGLPPAEGDLDGLPGLITITVEETDGTDTLYRVRAAVEWKGINPNRRFVLETLFADRQ